MIEAIDYIQQHSLEVAGTLTGVLYLWLEYRASIYLWIAGIVMPAVYIVVYYKAGLYADFGINIYYLVAAIYGWLVWTKGKQTANSSVKEELPITRIRGDRYAPLLAVVVLTWGGIAWMLITYTDSNVPCWDSFTTALSIVGLWMLTKKYLEQWFSWMAVDAVSCGLYLYKELYFTSVLYGFYTIIAIFGYFKWKKLMLQP
ncbi:nicotinamide riboside transporter PnuC [Phocaeicola abscessus]|uniref:nicotinamide riboside transporter PnuC n=1 Tax=Phocaeicola abscessus TaxID=555313 RepID=UPI0004B88385